MPLLFKLIPAVIHLGVLLRWFPPDSLSEVITLMVMPQGQRFANSTSLGSWFDWFSLEDSPLALV